MAEYKICFSVAGAFGAQISFEAKPGVSYEDAAAALDKDKLAKLICLDALGYSAKDIEIITPYDKSLTEMPIVFENRVALQSYIDKAILDTVLGFVKG